MNDIETVARAICIADGVNPDAIGYAITDTTREAIGDKYPLWKARIKQAEAAIAAVTERGVPSEISVNEDALGDALLVLEEIADADWEEEKGDAISRIHLCAKRGIGAALKARSPVRELVKEKPVAEHGCVHCNPHKLNKIIGDPRDSATIVANTLQQRILDDPDVDTDIGNPSTFMEAMKGLSMNDIRVGMKLKSTVPSQMKDVVVTELTEKGFKYTCEPYYVRAGGVSGTVSGGECYGHLGYSYYTEIEDDKS